MTTQNPPRVSSSLALMRHDLRGLTKEEIAELVTDMAIRMGVDPSLAPIDIIPTREGKLVPYVNARGAAELRKRHGISVTDLETKKDGPDVVVLIAHVRDLDGKTETGVGACEYDSARPATIARAWMVAETRAKRRATMSAVGIFLEAESDEVEASDSVA